MRPQPGGCEGPPSDKKPRTSGNPKGVLYRHRSQILHAFAVALPDVVGFPLRSSASFRLHAHLLGPWPVARRPPPESGAPDGSWDATSSARQSMKSEVVADILQQMQGLLGRL